MDTNSVGDGQGGLACCDSWGRKESDTIEPLNSNNNPSHWAFPGGASGKQPACQCRRRKTLGFDPWVGKTP